MNKSELLKLIESGENSGMEFKRDDIRPEQLGKEVVALANLSGGRIILGVEDDGDITGINRPNIEPWVMDTVCSQYVHPVITPYYEEVKIDDKRRVAVLTIGQEISKPYVLRNQGRQEIYVRVGSTSRLATREQQMRLHALGGMLHTELLPVPGSGLGDLDLRRVKDYLSSFVGDKTLPENDDEWHFRLCGLGFMVELEGRPPACTITGLVLFGNPQRRLLPQAGVRWMSFDGDEKSYEARDDRKINGPLVMLRNTSDTGGGEIIDKGLMENLIDAMRPFVSKESGVVDDSMRRERKWLYPVEALREAIINAIAHRDWTRNEEVEVVQYASRIEILSPGALQNSMTIEKMRAGQRSPRNQLIVDVLRDYGYVDARGMGVRNKIIPLLLEQNGREPEFIATEDYLKVIMYQKSEA